MKPRIFAAQRMHSFSAQPQRGNALLTAAGRVLQLGDVQALRAAWPQAEVIDFGGATITPGLTDAHIHITEWAWARHQVELADAATIDGCLQVIAGTKPGQGWLQGRGWNPHRWGGEYPDRHQLDTIVSDRPAALQSHDMHALWVNARALQLAGIDRHTPDPEGGRIVRDAQGEPTGMLLETAAQLVVRAIPLPDEQDTLDAVQDAQRALHGYGITGIHSFPGVHLPEPDPLTILTRLQAQDRLRLRVLQHISADKLAHAIALGLRSGFGGEWIRMGGIKMFLDGALGSRTAWMREPYEGSIERGVQVLPRDEFQRLVTEAATHDIAAVVHAIGDAAVAMAFDVLRQAPRVQTLPHRVEHVQCFPRESEGSLASGIICSVQPCHLMTDWRAADRHWGGRSAATYAFRTMLDGGAILACGSDAPVESADPRLGLYAAVARRDVKHLPAHGWHVEQRISLREVWSGYTLGAAEAAGASGQQGVLQPGAHADFSVWQQDPFEAQDRELPDLRVVATVVNGEVVFES
ncbi:MAG TPA: amidohydrolase [Longimicrobiales bacterium]|nr:amidohydrolase [Longimicrobiales bacterium]